MTAWSVRTWDPPVRNHGRIAKPGAWRNVGSCGLAETAEATVRQIARSGRVAEATSGSETMRGYPALPWRPGSFWRRDGIS